MSQRFHLRIRTYSDNATFLWLIMSEGAANSGIMHGRLQPWALPLVHSWASKAGIEIVSEHVPMPGHSEHVPAKPDAEKPDLFAGVDPLDRPAV